MINSLAADISKRPTGDKIRAIEPFLSLSRSVPAPGGPGGPVGPVGPGGPGGPGGWTGLPGLSDIHPMMGLPGLPDFRHMMNVCLRPTGALLCKIGRTSIALV